MPALPGSSPRPPAPPRSGPALLGLALALLAAARADLPATDLGPDSDLVSADPPASAPAAEVEQTGPEAFRLTEEEALRLALERNFLVQSARLDPEIARQEWRSAQGIFDPTLTASFHRRHDDNVEALSPALGIQQDQWEFGLAGLLPWGTQYHLGTDLQDFRTSLNGYAPGDHYLSFSGLTITQPLLRGFGTASQLAGVRIAAKSAQSAAEDFRETVLQVVADTLQACADLWLAQANLEVARSSRGLADKLLADNRRRVESGAMAPLDILLAESEQALREDAVIVAERDLRDAQLALANLISDQAGLLTSRPLALAAPPPVLPPLANPDLDLPGARETHPELRRARLAVESRELELARDRRDVWPQVDLVGRYGWRGLGDSLSESWDDLRQDRTQAYTVGLEVSVPIPNRERSALRAAAYLRRNRAQLEMRRLEQDFLLRLHGAANRLDSGWRRLRAAEKATALARQSLQAEEKKLQAGTSTTFVVIRLQQDLAQAEAREQFVRSDYRKAQADYDRLTGQSLVRHGLTLVGE